MKILYIILVMVHGLIHLLGFVKGFGFKEIKELTISVSKPMGLIWLSAVILIWTYGILYLFNPRHTWIVGIVVVAVSQTLIIIFWKDARFGTIPNILILLVSMASLGYHNYQKLVLKDTRLLVSKNVSIENKIVNESVIHHLPEPVKNWLRNSGAIGKPYISVGKVTQTAQLRMKAEQERWMSATAIQHTTIDSPGFIWTVDVKMNGLINFQGRDKFESGKGEMLIKMNSLINIVHEKGEKLDEASLQRFLGEMVWFPSLALSPYINWEPINDSAAKATMAYKGTKGSGTFYFNSNGDVIKFSAMRFKGNRTEDVRHEWIMNITDYKTFDGIKVPARMTSTWKLDKTDWTWLKLEISEIKYQFGPARLD